MRAILATLGSAGDVLPFLGIGRALRERGHEVILATNPHFRSVVEAGGLRFRGVGTATSYDRVTRDPDLWHPRRALSVMGREVILPGIAPIYDAVMDLLDRGRTVVVGNCLAFGARAACETTDVPFVTALTTPICLRSLREPPLLPGAAWARSLGTLGAWLTYRIGDVLIDHVLAGPLNEFRSQLGLPPVRGVMNEWWLSPRRVIGLWPDWYAPAQSDWPESVRLTGFVFHDAGAVPAKAARFLEDGPPPILFTPGTARRHAHAFFRGAVDACRRLGRRGILATPWREQVPPDLPADVLWVPSVPFGEVLPRSAAIAHHGGIGTVAQALRSGKPQLVCPASYDQFDNAARVVRLVAGATISGSRLAAALDRILRSDRIAAGGEEHAARLRGEDGARRACEAVEAAAISAAAV